MWQSVQPSGLGSSGGDKAASAGFSFSDPASSMMGSFSGGVPPSSDRGSVIMETSSSWSSPHHLLASSAAAFTDSNLYARAPANVYVVSTSTAATPFHGFGSIAASAQAPSMPFGFSFGSASNTLGSAHADPLSFTPDAALNKTLSYTSPGNVIAGKLNPPAADDICCVCQDAIQANETAGLVSCCKQVFHCHCINAALAHSSKCPLCKTIMDYPSGSSCVVSTMPSGTMTISLDPSMTCHGHTPGTIIIKYSIPSGVQKMCHSNPGTWTAYLPRNQEGCALLKRLGHAFCQGMTFTIGNSLTTGQNDTVTWTNILHKTSIMSFPDSYYFSHCNVKLDTLGVPPASCL